MHDMEPGASPWRKLADQVLSRVEQGRVNQGVVMDAERTSASVERGNETKSAPALGHTEAFLHMLGFEIGLR
jgi:hypothetical protein